MMSPTMKKEVYAYYEAYYKLTPVTNLTEDVETVREDVPITVEEFRAKQQQSWKKRLEDVSK